MGNWYKKIDVKLFNLSACIETILAIFLPFDITGFEGRKVGFPLAFTTLDKLKYSPSLSKRDINALVFIFDVLCVYLVLYCIKMILGRVKNGFNHIERK